MSIASCRRACTGISLAYCAVIIFSSNGGSRYTLSMQKTYYFRTEANFVCGVGDCTVGVKSKCISGLLYVLEICNLWKRNPLCLDFTVNKFFYEITSNE